MRIIASALISLALLAGAVAPAAANSTIKQLDQDRRGGHGGG